MRDPWLAVEKRFLAILAKDPKGNTGAKALYQAGRSREELARRSFLTGDWRQAANYYLDLGKKFPKHSLADDGLFQAAYIAAKQLQKPEEARRIAQTVLDRYPKGDMVGNARELLATLPKQASSAKPATGKTTAPVRAESAAPQPANAGKPATQAAGTVSRGKPEAGALTRILCRGTSRRSTVMLELDGAASFRHQYLAASAKQPARLVVDIDSVVVKPDVKPSVAFTGMTVSRARTSVVGGGDKKGVRVVIDLGNIRHYTVDTGTNPPGIHVQCSISRDLAGGRTPPADGKNGPVVQGRFSGRGPGQPGTLMEQLGLTVKTIMIDAGHGGKDPGAMGNGITEKHVTLTLAKMVGERLKKQGFTVLFTRQNDSFVALDQRAVMANNKKADLFISLHVNSSTDKKTNGLETYFLDLARTSSAATVAARENAVSVKNISDLQFILTDLMLTSKLQESQDLAATVHGRMFARLRQAGFVMNDNGVRSAPFYVLMGARMPAVLVEVGYLSNAEDARRIKNQKYLERLADGVAQGVVDYKTKLARFTGK
ncbi:MAG: N-acetylmuramoyl-L-alanine amidase [Deltaproteobacteria bacterium]|nr:N-acetylmuramoyl-L-alanine amidase [Deltaproteobacteria bacterium]